MLRIRQIHLAALSALTVAVAAAEPTASPYDHGGPELAAGKAPTIVPGRTPIKHQAYFRGERELFGYAPRFMPGEVAFDPQNRPYIRTSFLRRTSDGRTIAGATETFVQTLNDQGRWVVHSLEQAVREFDPAFVGTVGQGLWAGETRVVSDRAGDLYTVVTAKRRALLLHLRRGAAKWAAYELPRLSRPTLEGADTYDRQARPPIIVAQYGGLFVDVRRGPEGTLEVSQPIRFAPKPAFLNPGHSGAGPVAARVGARTYLVYGLAQAQKDKDGETIPGTPQYVVTYDHEQRVASAPVLLDFGRNCYTPKPDSHCGPTIVADSEGFLHVILGAHQDHLWHVRSKVRKPSSPDDWTKPEALGLKRRYDCGLTYTALVIDSTDTLHLVTRNLSRGLDANGNVLPPGQKNMKSMMRTLDYFRAKRQEDGTWRWEERGPLVVPLWHYAYSIFYHRLTLDRRGRLFLSYYYYADQLSDETKAAYRAKWPEEAKEGQNVKPAAHDPVFLVSEDSGDTWRFALTDDLMPK